METGKPVIPVAVGNSKRIRSVSLGGLCRLRSCSEIVESRAALRSSTRGRTLRGLQRVGRSDGNVVGNVKVHTCKILGSCFSNV